MKSRLILFVWAVIALVVLSLLLKEARHPRSPGIAQPTANSSVSTHASPGPEAEAPPPAEERSHLADLLNSPSGDIHADLRMLNDIFDAYRSATRQSNPVGENVEITQALTGHNRLGVAFILPDNPAINAKGELCDRWGTPFFFHSLSGTQMEIRSAGPDKKLWTEDDQVLTPGLRKPEL